ncbi:MAG: acyl-ACP--UDP-N-acetylglucosamine O-acyltransferase [Alphaproteobacteria bacterium]
MAQKIHPTAIVKDGAKLGADVEIGAYSVIGPNVELADGVRLQSHVVVGGHTKIGAETQIFPFASIGLSPQDLKYDGEDSRLVVGARNTIREYVTLNPGTSHGNMETRIGDDCLFMACAHVGHDCVVGNQVILANSVAIAGHCVLGDFAIFGGLSCIQQFGRAGAHCFIGGASATEKDVIPFGMAIGNRASLAGLNLVGLKRRGFTREDLRALMDAFAEIFQSQEGTLHERAEAVAKESQNQHVGHLTDFLLADKKRPILSPARGAGS